MGEMEIDQVELAEIVPYDKNARINEGAVEAVAESIRQFGFRNPILLDGDGVIICGHTRLLASKSLGLETVPVIFCRDLSPEKVRALRLADNRSSELSTWDMELLMQELAALNDDGVDASAWFADELQALSKKDGETDVDAIPEMPEEAISKPGEIYGLGDHRLFVGDATNGKHMSVLMRDDKADLYLTDPPYNIQYSGGMKKREAISNDAMPDKDFRKMIASAFSSADEFMHPGAVFYIWHGDSEGYNFRGACIDTEWQIRQCLIWNKSSSTMGRQDYRWKHEPCLTGWKGGASHNWYGDRKQVTVLNFDRPSRSTDHPTMKPVELFSYLIANSSARGDIILDSFAGSGTTAISAEQLGREARLMEIDPGYADVIRKRWAEFVHGEGCDWQNLTSAI